jgi:nitrite reductase/ring-hydroxylating ferredoxin subunit/uncharacterized membrane protein
MSGIQGAPILVPEVNQNTTSDGNKDHKRRGLTSRVSAWIIGSKLTGKIASYLDEFLHHCFAPPAMRQVKLFLNGTWAGHPLHPALTDVPIGAWTIVIALDLTALLFHLPQLGLASCIAVLVGVAGALGAIAAGLADWMDVDPPEKAIGAFHAIVNVTATVLFFCSFLVRWNQHWQPGWKAFFVSLAGYLLVMGGGYLGGVMVFHMGVMVNRNAYRSGPADFTPVVMPDHLAEGQLQRVLVEEQPILLVKIDEQIHALGAVCSHYGAPLSEGKIIGGAIECPWHASRFSLEDGSVVQGPACDGIPVYDCRMVDGQVQIKIR